MIADDSLSSAFDDLTDLFLGGSAGAPCPAGPAAVHRGEAQHNAALRGAGSVTNGSVPCARPVRIEGLVLGNLPTLGSLWASQYPRMTADAESGPVALIRLQDGTARVEIFQPTRGDDGHARGVSVDRFCGLSAVHAGGDLAVALARTVRLVSRVIVCASTPADELLLTRHPCVRTVALLTAADDASAVGAYRAIKRLSSAHAPDRTVPLGFKVAVMGSDDARASAAFHRLADAVKSFLSLPIESAGQCRQISGGVPGVMLFDGPSAMTLQGVLDLLDESSSSGTTLHEETELRMMATGCPPAESQNDVHTARHETSEDSVTDASARVGAFGPEVAVVNTLPAGCDPLPIRCPFDREPTLAIDQEGHPQVVASAAAGQTAFAVERLVAVGAWLWHSRELLSMVCPSLCTQTRPVLHLVTDRPVDVKRLVDSDLRLHVRVTQPGTLPLN